MGGNKERCSNNAYHARHSLISGDAGRLKVPGRTWPRILVEKPLELVTRMAAAVTDGAWALPELRRDPLPNAGSERAHWIAASRACTCADRRGLNGQIR